MKTSFFLSIFYNRSLRLYNRKFEHNFLFNLIRFSGKDYSILKEQHYNKITNRFIVYGYLRLCKSIT